MPTPRFTQVLDLLARRGVTLSRGETGRLRVRPPEALDKEEIETLRPWADVLHALVALAPLTPQKARNLHRTLGAGAHPEAEEAFVRVVRAFKGKYLPGAILRAVEMPPAPKRFENPTQDEPEEQP
ncbi:hypothetical protein [Oceanithermus sp.]|uniref:hypothetical protein n=1 Tax=Oceanithermus sp. TaxID=2268145 RepID=UPI00257CCF3A|nr:hypothetical protein [Oceanithermus sp.]